MKMKMAQPKLYRIQVYCNGKAIMETYSTKKELNVNIWSGNHPFYISSNALLNLEGNIQKFEEKYKFNL